MGTAESTLSRSQVPVGDVITTVSERVEDVDLVLEKFRSLRVTPPILESPLAEGSLSDILVKKPPSSAARGSIDPKVLVELFSLYRTWHEDKVRKITKKQEEVENKVELVDALAVKLLQRFNYSVSTMKATLQHLSEETVVAGTVHKLQMELGELKGRLTEVISNCDAICKRITSEGPESLSESVAPLAAVACVGSVNNHQLFTKGPPSDETGTE